MYFSDNRSTATAERRVGRGSHKRSPKIWRVMMFLEQSFSRPLTLRRAAAEVDLHPDYLSRRFKFENGIGFHEYLLMLRLERATNLLVTSTKSIKEIAYEVGFRAPEVFSKAFTRCFSCPPRVYREHNLVPYATPSPSDPHSTGTRSRSDPLCDSTERADCLADCREDG